MSFIEKAKRAISENLSNARDLIGLNLDKVEGAIDSVGDFIDYKTGGKFNNEELVETLRIDLEQGEHVPPLGILKYMGYRVGKSGLLLHERREILRRTFEVQLVPISPWAEDYIRDCGQRCSQSRYNKMDRILGGLINNAGKISKNDMSEAIRNWREDREWLRQNHQQWMDHTH
jgi:hypothetical protein